jgi:ribosome-binding protein aMBF1 (putative translation factor)
VSDNVDLVTALAAVRDRIRKLNLELVAHIVAVRKQRGVSARQLSRDLGIRWDVWSRFENGRWFLDSDDWGKVAIWLATPPATVGA